MDAIILAAGIGRRMAPLCTRVPKPTLPLAGRPILQHLLDRAAAAGVTRAVIVVHHGADVVRERLAAPDGVRVVFIDQGEPRGTGHAVAAAAGKVKGDALVLMGDSLVSQTTLKALANGKGFLVAGAEVEDASPYGLLRLKGKVVQGIAEKAKAVPGTVNTGFYRVPGAVLQRAKDLRPSPRGELEFTDLLDGADAQLVQADDWIDIGTPWQYLAAHEALLPQEMAGRVHEGRHGGPGHVEHGVHIRGRLWVEEGATVKAGTYVEGDVLVGAGAYVGPNAYLRGPVEIGPGCKVGAATEIKNSILLEGAHAPHLHYIGDSILGHGCNLGAGTKIANLKVTEGTVKVDWDGKRLDTGRRKFGAVVGDDAKTGINVSINPGTILGAGALVGAGLPIRGWVAPGAVVRG